MPQEFVAVAKLGELAPGEKKLVFVGDKRVLLEHLASGYYALQELCSHEWARLSKGRLCGEELMCPLHRSAFDVKTGAVLSPPASGDLTVYPVVVNGEDILIGTPEL